MFYILKNHAVTVTLSDLGAEIVSVRSGQADCEYIWQADPAYWQEHAPLLFPICGRLFEGHYRYGGKTYEMGLHGFARHLQFAGRQEGADSAEFILTSNEQTRKCYPFDFILKVRYRLEGNRLGCEITVQNTGDGILPATVGAHPGFNVPLDSGRFDDWYLEFGEACSPDELMFSDNGFFITGKKKAFPIENGKKLPLCHDLFYEHSIFISRMARTVTLRSDKSERFVTLEYPDMPYLGLWHAQKSEAPYVCIEPWCGLPSFDGEVDDFAQKCDMFRIPAGEEKTVRYAVTFG